MEKRNSNGIIIPDVLPMLIVFVALTVLVYFWRGIWSALIPLALVVFTLCFFRNPNRVISAEEDEIVSPADGVILAVEEVNENKYLHGEATKVSIFLSILMYMLIESRLPEK